MSIRIIDGQNGPSDTSSATLLARASSEPAWATWAEEHLEAWRDAYRSFGAKPKRTPCSAEALRRRAAKGERLPQVNAIVDIYNALSVLYAVPIGGEDVSGYTSAPRLFRASGTEVFKTTANGAPAIETAEPGEVVWGDDAGVTCRRWNWRQGTRTCITEATSDMWFVLERLEPMPIAALLEAGERLVAELRRLAPTSQVSTMLIDATNRRSLD